MKKILFYALAAFTLLGAGCSQDTVVDNDVVRGNDGQYTLSKFSATLDVPETDELETRASLGTNYVVNWTGGDCIAIINKKNLGSGDAAITYYILDSGAGSPIGTFAPLGSKEPIKFDDKDDLVAVYPGVAASVKNNEIYVELNTNYDAARRVNAGVFSWTPSSSEFAFSNNDVKVSYKTEVTKTEENTSHTENQITGVNFKFKQLATWCIFSFDFSGGDEPMYLEESMQKLTVTTTKGSNGGKKITGKAKINFTDANNPYLEEAEATNTDVSGYDPYAIVWETTGSLATTLTKSLMLFPTIQGHENQTNLTNSDQLKIEVETESYVFDFYATPSPSFTPGQVLTFPISLSKFTKTDAKTDLSYTVEENRDQPKFYFYGDTNCILVKNTETSVDIDITPHQTNAYFWQTSDMLAAKADDAPLGMGAKVVWWEGFTSAPAPSTSVENNKVTVSNLNGNGNALIAITDQTGGNGNILWSFHIWKPKMDVEANLLEYNYTSSREIYNVMPLALGAMDVINVNYKTQELTSSNSNILDTYGLYYQWGRKDPLGRAGVVASNTFKTFNGNSKVETAGTQLSTLLGGDNTTEMNDNTITKTGPAGSGKIPVGLYMLNYTTQHPDEFIYMLDGRYNNDWYGPVTNDHLWGNARGYNFPRFSNDQHRSIFDPCPKGYRVAPKGLWINFTDDGANQSQSTLATKLQHWNVAVDDSSNEEPTTAKKHGYYFYYRYGLKPDGSRKWRSEIEESGKDYTDFYPASGYRNRTSGALTNVGSNGNYWSSSPQSAGSTSAGNLGFYATYVYPLNSNPRAYGFTVRCVREK